MRLLVDAQGAVDVGIDRQRCEAESAAGLMLETIEPAAVRSSALKDVFAAIDSEEAGVGEAATGAAGGGDRASRRAAEAAGQAMQEILGLPEIVRDLALEAGAGWQFAGPGVRSMELMRDGSAKAELIRLEPGRGVPRHGHDGREFTLVLTGAFHDGRARYACGELCAADPSTEHKPVAEDGEVCIALAVTDGPLAFTGPLGWVQRAMGG
jgi:putative transcriptional regulator